MRRVWVGCAAVVCANEICFNTFPQPTTILPHPSPTTGKTTFRIFFRIYVVVVVVVGALPLCVVFPNKKILLGYYELF